MLHASQSVRCNRSLGATVSDQKLRGVKAQDQTEQQISRFSCLPILLADVQLPGFLALLLKSRIYEEDSGSEAVR